MSILLFCVRMPMDHQIGRWIMVQTSNALNMRDFGAHTPPCQSILTPSERVAIGVKFLSKHAPKDWELDFLKFGRNKHVFAWVNVNYDNECPLALAFSNDSRIPSHHHHVHEADVLRFLYPKLGSIDHRRRLGFESYSLKDSMQVSDAWKDAIWKRLANRPFPRIR